MDRQHEIQTINELRDYFNTTIKTQEFVGHFLRYSLGKAIYAEMKRQGKDWAWVCAQLSWMSESETRALRKGQYDARLDEIIRIAHAIGTLAEINFRQLPSEQELLTIVGDEQKGPTDE